VAVALGSDLRRAMLACTLYAAADNADANLESLGESVLQFLDGTSDLAPAGTSPPPWEYINMERVSEEDDGDYVDPYLRLPSFSARSWSPLVSYMVRGALSPHSVGCVD
jgi:hypothetical protein